MKICVSFIILLHGSSEQSVDLSSFTLGKSDIMYSLICVDQKNKGFFHKLACSIELLSTREVRKARKSVRVGRGASIFFKCFFYDMYIIITYYIDSDKFITFGNNFTDSAD